MAEFKLCDNGEFMPVNLACPPPLSGPYYYYPYGNIPTPPTGSSSTYVNNIGGGGAPISAGAVAGIIILMGFITIMVCFITIKFRTRLFRGSIVRLSHNTRNGRHMELHQGGAAAAELASMNSGDVLLDVVGGGLEEKLVNLLPVFEYVRFQDDGKKLLDVQQKLGRSSSSCNECAVCLSLFEEKDIVRILPKCKHVFHLLCIDKWFESHANCPLCRERITLQTIQLYFLSSEDRTAINASNDRRPSPDVDEHDQRQLAVFDACPDGLNHPGNGNNHHNPAPHHYQNHSFSQQAAEPFDTPCAPHDNQIDAPSSAACNDDGHHAPKPYQSTQLVEGTQAARHVHQSTELTSALLQEYPFHYQSFSFPTYNHAAQSDQKELSACDADEHAANHEAARSPRSPLLSTASKQRGLLSSYHKMIRSHSQKQRYCCIKPGQDNENLPIPALVMSSLRAQDSSLPLFQRSHSAGSLIEHYPTSLYSPELL